MFPSLGSVLTPLPEALSVIGRPATLQPALASASLCPLPLYPGWQQCPQLRPPEGARSWASASVFLSACLPEGTTCWDVGSLCRTGARHSAGAPGRLSQQDGPRGVFSLAGKHGSLWILEELWAGRRVPSPPLILHLPMSQLAACHGVSFSKANQRPAPVTSAIAKVGGGLTTRILELVFPS